MGGQWRPDILPIAGFIVAALLIIVGVVRARVALILSGPLVLVVSVAAGRRAASDWWVGDMLALASLVAAYLLIVGLSRRDDTGWPTDTNPARTGRWHASCLPSDRSM